MSTRAVIEFSTAGNVIRRRLKAVYETAIDGEKRSGRPVADDEHRKPYWNIQGIVIIERSAHASRDHARPKSLPPLLASIRRISIFSLERPRHGVINAPRATDRNVSTGLEKNRIILFTFRVLRAARYSRY